MVFNRDCIAMILAGGQGSRLYALTQGLAKPAVPFGGKYRIIDFPLSNCVNSGFDTVGVLTQYQPLELNEYIGNGQPWDLDRRHGGVFILPPYQKSSGSDWYKGTANAIYQNIDFIKKYDPTHVLILSGDHIYKMNYAKMLKEHIKTSADCTIGVFEVTIEEASRFGIMNTNDDNSIYEFEEKPQNPKSNLASMGIYIFKTDVLIKYLTQDEKNENSSNDFGKNIIPAMLDDNKKLMAYSFKGYWKDVGTIESLWEANMDLLDNPEILSSPQWRIYARNAIKPPQYIAKNADVKRSLISEGVEVHGFVHNSILFPDVFISKNAVVKDSIIMQGTHIDEGAVICSSIISENCVIDKGAKVGESPTLKKSAEITVVASNVHIGKDAFVKAKSMVEEDVEEVKSE